MECGQSSGFKLFVFFCDVENTFDFRSNITVSRACVGQCAVRTVFYTALYVTEVAAAFVAECI